MKLSEKEIGAVSALAPDARFKYFVKRVADTEVAWGLYNLKEEGWATMQTPGGTDVLPLWPAKEYAQLHRTGPWAEDEPEEIDLDDLLEEMAPRFKANGVLPGIFPTPDGRGATVSWDELEEFIRAELAKYG